VYAGTGDGILTKIRIPELIVVNRWQLGTKSIRSIKFSEKNNFFAIGSSDTTIRIWDIDKQAQTKVWEAHQNSVFSLKFSPDGMFLASVGRDANLKLWNIAEDFRVEKAVPAHNYGIHDVNFHPTEPYLATASMDKSVKIWHWPSLKLLKVLDKARHAGHGTSVNAVYWSLYKNQLITAGDDRKISVWQLDEDLLHQRAIQ
jgi:WD40 repeat protein